MEYYLNESSVTRLSEFGPIKKIYLIFLLIISNLYDISVNFRIKHSSMFSKSLNKSIYKFKFQNLEPSSSSFSVMKLLLRENCRLCEVWRSDALNMTIIHCRFYTFSEK